MPICPHHDVRYPAYADCYWCLSEAEATDQAAGLALVRSKLPPRRPRHPDPPSLADLADPPREDPEDEADYEYPS
jgi:hypothetical protein